MKVAIYSRKSILTDVGNSIGNQINMIKNYFKNEQCTFEIFEDEGFSGGNTNRPSFNLMMKKVKDNCFDVVAVYRIDRISRNIVDFVNIYEDLQNHNVNLISITENFDPSTPYGKLVMIILATFAEMEREGISQRVKDNKIENAKLGKWGGGAAPFGYEIDRTIENGKSVSYLVAKTDIDFVKDIFNSYLKFKSLHKVQIWLYETSDIKWSLSTVRYILSNPIYCCSNSKVIDYLSSKNITVYGTPNGKGFISYGSRPRKKGIKEWNSKDMFIAVSKHYAPIDSDLWIKTQVLLEENAIAPRPKSSKVSFLTGLLRCGVCGSPLTVNYNHTNKDGTKNYYYVCTGKRKYGVSYCNNKNINNWILDDYVLKKLLDKKIEKIEVKSDNSKQIATIEKRINKNSTKIEKLVNNLMEVGNEAALVINKKLKELSIENENLKSSLWKLNNENSNNSLSSEEYDEVLTVIENSDHEAKRELLGMIIDRIEWNCHLPHGEDIKIFPK